MIDTLVTDPGFLVDYAIIGTYNDVDGGTGASFFSTFADASAAEGKTFDDIFAGPEWNAIEGPYTEEQVLAALKDPLGDSDSENGLIISYLMGFILFDGTGIATPFTESGVPAESNTLYHFSDATPFGTGSVVVTFVPVTAVPEPSGWALALTGIATALLARGRLRRVA
jgi:hypothetical protein